MNRIVATCLLTITASWAQSQEQVSLSALKSMALEHNYKVRIATEQVGASHALSQAAHTNFFPSISANGVFNRNNRDIKLLKNDLLIPVIPFSAINPETGEFNPTLDPANTFVFNPINGTILTDRDGNPVFKNYAWLPKDNLKLGNKNIFAGGISLTQPIYTGGKIRELYRMSQHGGKIAAANLTKEQQELLYNVEEGYWRVVSLQEKVQVTEQYLSLLQKLTDDMQNLYNEGIIIRNDVLRVSVKTSEVKLNMAKASNGLELSKMALCQMVGMPFSSSIVLTDSLPEGQLVLPKVAYTDSALAKRPEVVMLEQAVGIARSGVNIMRSRYLPSVGLTAGFNVMNPNPFNGFSPEFGADWNVGLAITIPIYHWNDKAHTLRAARHEQRVAELKLAEARELISLQVQQSQFKLSESRRRVQMAKENLSLADENLRVTTNAFTEGMVKTSDVLEAQALWYDAMSNLIDARMESQLCHVNLSKVVGQLGHKPLDK